MMSPRAQQKSDRHASIVRAAEAAFLEKGFDDTSIADIAGRAGLSERTVYNYFSSKDRILLSIWEYYTELWLDEASAHLSRMPGNPAAAITKVLAAELDFALRYLPSMQLWRDIITVSIKWAGQHEEPGFLQSARAQARPLEELLRRLIAAGKLRAGIDVPGTAWLFYSLSRSAFRDTASSRDGSMAECKRLLAWQIEQVCDGLVVETRAAKTGIPA